MPTLRPRAPEDRTYRKLHAHKLVIDVADSANRLTGPFLDKVNGQTASKASSTDVEACSRDASYQNSTRRELRRWDEHCGY